MDSVAALAALLAVHLQPAGTARVRRCKAIGDYATLTRDASAICGPAP